MVEILPSAETGTVVKLRFAVSKKVVMIAVAMVVGWGEQFD